MKGQDFLTGTDLNEARRLPKLLLRIEPWKHLRSRHFLSSHDVSTLLMTKIISLGTKESPLTC
jgi:hypothetical protein